MSECESECVKHKYKVIKGECYVRGSDIDQVQPYVAYKITSSSHAVAASLHIMLKHMADMHSLMLEVMSEKYKIPYDDIVEALNSDPRVQKMMVEPTLHSLNYFSQEDLDKVQSLFEDGVDEITEKVRTTTLDYTVEHKSEEPKETLPIVEEEVKPKTKRIIKIKKPVEVAEKVLEQVQAPALTLAQELPKADPPVKKRVILKKKPIDPTP